MQGNSNYGWQLWVKPKNGLSKKIHRNCSVIELSKYSKSNTDAFRSEIWDKPNKQKHARVGFPPIDISRNIGNGTNATYPHDN